MSAPDVNRVVLVGRLPRRPQSRELRDGETVCELSLAMNPTRERKPLFFVDVATFGKRSDVRAQYLTEVRHVAVAGRLARDDGETEDDQTPLEASRSRQGLLRQRPRPERRQARRTR